MEIMDLLQGHFLRGKAEFISYTMFKNSTHEIVIH